MQIWPAIDLRGGKCVRLRQGDYDRETVFGDDPVAIAKQWVTQGASYLHLVDLDGARDGEPANHQIAAQIAKTTGATCELGGGIRTEETIENLLGLGVARLVIGTRALKEPDWFARLCERYPKTLVLGLDARDGLVATDGWLQTSQTPATKLAQRFLGVPVAAIVYTDIAVDGMMSGPNVPAVAALQEAVDIPVIASGGVTTKEDVALLAGVGVAGCIIGRALYEGTITIPAALEAAGQAA